MKLLRKLCLFCMMGLLAFSAQAQVKLGHANFQALISLMPEMTGINDEITKIEKQLAETIQIKQAYGQTKLIEYQNAAQQPDVTPESLKPLEEELTKLQQEVQDAQAKAQQQILRKRQELMEPVFKKMKDVIAKVATDKGYDMIINSVDGSGMSIVLHGPEEHELTEELASALGIEIPAETAN